MANRLPVATFPGKNAEPQTTEPLVDPQRRITPNWRRWTEFVDISLRRMITLFTFLALNDTPDSYTGQTLKAVRVKSDESGLEFFTVPSAIGDVVGPASAVNNHVAFFDGVTGKLIKDSGLTLSGSNTGDQTITLSGNVTGSGTGSFATTIAAGVVTEAMQVLANNTTNNVTSTKHGYAPISPADATQFLNGAATPAWALVKDSDLSTSDITTNNVSTSKHGFTPKLPNDATKFLDGTGAYTVPPGTGGYTDEQAQDAVGVMVDATLVYVDATPLLTRAALTGDVKASQSSNTVSVSRIVQIQVTDPAGSALTTGDGKAYYRINSRLNGFKLTAVAAALAGAVSTSGIPTFQVASVTGGVDILSTPLTIDANETDSSTAATAAVINTSNNTVATADMLRIDIDVAGTGAKGLIIDLTFTPP